jgi:hypothetical protein
VAAVATVASVDVAAAGFVSVVLGATIPVAAAAAAAAAAVGRFAVAGAVYVAAVGASGVPEEWEAL